MEINVLSLSMSSHVWDVIYCFTINLFYVEETEAKRVKETWPNYVEGLGWGLL
jgi:hypothetical protein